MTEAVEPAGPVVEPLTETETADLDALAEAAPRVGFVVAGDEELPALEPAAAVLDDAGVLHETRVLAHQQDPGVVADYAGNARMRGLRVLIAAAGEAHEVLPGVVAAHTDLPVIALPLGPRAAADVALVPAGTPLAVVAPDDARNAGHLALRILRA